RNWAGRFGATFADGSLQFFGLAALVAPLALLALGWRRLLSRPVGARGTKGLGVALVVLALAPLAHLALGRPRAFGGGLDAGGFVGDLLGSFAVSALNPPGAAILLSAGLLIGLLLATSLSLGDGLSGTTLRLSGWWRGFLLERRRRRELALKEKQRRDVVKKHLERAKEDAARPAPQKASEPEGDVVYIPSVATLRVKEKAGAGRFSIRKAGGAEGEPPRPVTRPALLEKKADQPQRILPFPAPRDAEEGPRKRPRGIPADDGAHRRQVPRVRRRGRGGRLHAGARRHHVRVQAVRGGEGLSGRVPRERPRARAGGGKGPHRAHAGPRRDRDRGSEPQPRPHRAPRGHREREIPALAVAAHDRARHRRARRAGRRGPRADAAPPCRRTDGRRQERGRVGHDHVHPLQGASGRSQVHLRRPEDERHEGLRGPAASPRAGHHGSQESRERAQVGRGRDGGPG